MKKILFSLMALIVAVAVTSCTGTVDEAGKVAEKMKTGQQLDPADYSTMIKYVGEYAEKMQPYVVEGTEGQYDAEKAKLAEEYPYVAEFRDCIAHTSLDQLSEEDMQLVNKYAGYIEFTAPEGTTIQTDPEAAGLEEATPEQPDGVVAGAVDEVKQTQEGF